MSLFRFGGLEVFGPWLQLPQFGGLRFRALSFLVTSGAALYSIIVQPADVQAGTVVETWVFFRRNGAIIFVLVVIVVPVGKEAEQQKEV